MSNDCDDKKQAVDELVVERNAELNAQRRYYDRLHFIELYPLNSEVYYENLKDWTKFKEPKDTSYKDAEKDSGISAFLKVKALFSKASKSILNDKKLEAKILQKEYSDLYSKRVERLREQFYKRQEQRNNEIDLMKENLKKHDSVEVLKFFKAVLQSDEFTLDMLGTYEPYRNDIVMKGYDPKTGVLSYKYRIPNPEEVCVIDKFYYDVKSDRIISRDLEKTRARNIRIKIARAILLRSAAMVYYSDNYENIKRLRISGYLNYYDSALGNERDISVMILEISKDVFKQINLERARLNELFERVIKTKDSAGLYNKKLYELEEVE